MIKLYIQVLRWNSTLKFFNLDFPEQFKFYVQIFMFWSHVGSRPLDTRSLTSLSLSWNANFDRSGSNTFKDAGGLNLFGWLLGTGLDFELPTGARVAWWNRGFGLEVLLWRFYSGGSTLAVPVWQFSSLRDSRLGNRSPGESPGVIETLNLRLSIEEIPLWSEVVRIDPKRFRVADHNGRCLKE